MNLKKLAKYIILIWLPIASLALLYKRKINNLLPNEENSKIRKIMFEKEKKIVVEIVKEKTEKNPSKVRPNKLNIQKLLGGSGSSSRASENIPKNSANSSLFKKSYGYLKSEMDVKSAHKVNISVKKDLSALNIINTNKNESDSVLKMKTKKNSRNKKFKNLKSNISKREAVMEISLEEDSDDPSFIENYDEEELESGESNSTEMGSYLGAPCELTCSEKLIHVFCDPKNGVCECEEKYPVQIGVGTGCEKPKQLGDQCFYAQTCSFFDPNAECAQINHNAVCQCKPGYHTVALRKGVKRMFCSEDVTVVSADLPTLLGVATGIAVLTGLICFVLRLFSGNRYPNTRHYASTNIAPPLLLSSDNQWINGIPLTVHGRPSSRSSCQRSTTSLTQYSRTKGVMVPASRAGAARAAAILLIPCHLQASRHPDSEVINNSNNDDTEVQETEVEQSSRLGSRRPSLSSVHSTTSSQKSMSYSARRFEQENQQREQRAAMRAAREEAARAATPATPSPMSTDLLIPSSNNIEEEPLCLISPEPTDQSESSSVPVNKDSISTVSGKNTSDLNT